VKKDLIDGIVWFGIILALVAGLMIAPRMAGAQSDGTLRACTAADYTLMVSILEPHLETFQTVSAALGTATPGALAGLIEDVDTAQVQWWSTDAPLLPDCRVAWQARLLTGRFYDEVLIGLLMFDANYFYLTDPHIDALSEVGGEFTVLAGQIQ